MPRHNRQTLKSLFKQGVIERAYEDLIDSTINISEDGLFSEREHGLILTPKGTSRRLISFFENIADLASPIWTVSFKESGNAKHFQITERHETRFYIQAGGKVGIGTEVPGYKLDVNGLVSMKGRVGNFAKGYIPADGKWHPIPQLSDLKGCMAFEIIAHINDYKDHRFGLTYATLLMSNGLRGAKNSVRTVNAGSSWLWGKFWNKIFFKWVVDPSNSSPEEEKYMIVGRSRSHYGARDGKAKQIFFRASKLWDAEYEMDAYSEAERTIQDTRSAAASSEKAAPEGDKDSGGMKFKKRTP